VHRLFEAFAVPRTFKHSTDPIFGEIARLLTYFRHDTRSVLL
jgi:hypothetical protein